MRSIATAARTASRKSRSNTSMCMPAEATLNAALATIDSMQPRSELQAILAVQIIATGFAGLRFRARNGNFKRGVWTRENVERRRAVQAQIRGIRALLRATQPAT